MQRCDGFLDSLAPRSVGLLEKLHANGNSGIDRRHLALDSIMEPYGEGAEWLANHFEREAPALAVNALQRALDDAGLAPGEVDALFLCTCTGYLCPGATSHVAEQMGMRDDVYLADLVGLGCGAAIPMLRAAHGFLAANPGAIVATVAVETCSSAFYADNDPGVLVSMSLFGDGAAASIWTSDCVPGDWQIGHFTTTHRPDQRGKLRFVNAGGMLKNQLHRDVPRLAGESVAELYSRRSATPDAVISHAGGRDVVEALEEVLPFSLGETRAVLRDFGNMSSPSVLFALERRLDADHPTDQRLWLTAFGAGFAAHACEMWR